MFTSRLLPPAARLLCGESGQSGGIRGRDGGAEAAVSILDAPGSSRLVVLKHTSKLCLDLCIFYRNAPIVIF